MLIRKYCWKVRERRSKKHYFVLVSIFLNKGVFLKRFLATYLQVGYSFNQIIIIIEVRTHFKFLGFKEKNYGHPNQNE